MLIDPGGDPWPPEQLVAASRKQVLAWKAALGDAYYPLAGGRYDIRDGHDHDRARVDDV